MSITYKRNEKCGEATFRQTFKGTDHVYTVDLYVGNCFLIMVKSTEKEDILHSFFVDEDHMKRCLKNDIFTGIDTLTAITINKAKCRNYKKIVALLIEYMNDVDIVVYKDGNYTWHEFAAPRRSISDFRFRELAEIAISYLNDEYMLNEFCEDRGIEFDEEEKSYFGIEEDDYEM